MHVDPPNRLLVNVLRSAGVCIIATDLTGLITFFNPIAEEWLGWSSEEVVGVLAPTSFHVVDEVVARASALTQELGRVIEPGFEAFVAKADATGLPDVHEWTYVRRNGTRFQVLLSITPVLDDDENVTGYLGIAHDITNRKLTEEALRASERRMRALFDSAPLVIGILGPDRRFREANRYGTELLGYSREQILGQTTRAFYDSDADYQAVGREIEARLATGPFASLDLRLRHRDGHLVDVLLNAAAVDARDPTAGCVVTLLDVTDRKRAEREMAFVAAASQTLADSLHIRTTAARAANLGVQFLADWCVVDLVEGARLVRVATATANTDGDRNRAAAEGDGPAVTALSLGASYIVHDVTSDPFNAERSSPAYAQSRSLVAVPLVSHGHSIGAMTFGLASNGARLDQRSIALAEEIALRAAGAIENARLYAQSQASIRERDEFLSIASHELRGPLTSARLMVQGLASGGLSLEPEMLRKSLSIIERQTKRLTTLVNDLMNVGRIHLNRLELQPQPVDLARLVRDAVEQLGAETAQAGCAISIRTDTPVNGQWDADKLMQVVTNLVSNAIKFGARKPVEIAVSNGGAYGRISVTDHGIGISADALPHVFEKFERAVSARSYGGLGLGLYIAQQIVSRMGGTIRADSIPGLETRFLVELPLDGSEGA